MSNLLKFLLSVVFVFVFTFVSGLIILKPIYIAKSNQFLEEEFSHLPKFEKQALFKNLYSCQKVQSNRYMVNPLNYFNTDQELHSYVKMTLNNCFIYYIINGKTNAELRFREQQLEGIVLDN